MISVLRCYLLGMNKEIDWAAILPAILILAISIIFIILVIFEIQQYEKHLNVLKQRQVNQFQTVDAEYKQLKKISDLVQNGYLTKYNELITSRFIKKRKIANFQTQRLKLFTKIEKTLKKLPLITAYYAVSKTKHDSIQDVKIYQTQLTLKLGVLHEGDLLETIEKIMALSIQGVLILKKCSLKPLTEKIDLNKVSEPYFEALCVFSWHLATLK